MSRRTTLGPITHGSTFDPNPRSMRKAHRSGNNAANIRSSGPMSTAKKKKKKKGHRARHSMAPSIASTESRRKSSSMYGLAPAYKLSDPRPINDRGYMNQSIRTVIGFLVQHRYDHSISPKTLMAPSGRDFFHIIQFLFRNLDDNFQFGSNMVNDLPVMFKGLHYPFAISKTALSAVGSPHTWPVLLAAVTWLIEVVNYQAEAGDIPNVTTNATGEIEGNEDAAGPDGLFFEYLRNAYTSFMEGRDQEYENIEAELKVQFSNVNASGEEEARQLSERNKDLKSELENLKAASSSLQGLKERRRNLRSDLAKFNSYLEELQNHISNHRSKVSEISDRLSQKQTTLNNLLAEKDKLEDRIETQELNADDVERMAAQRADLQAQLDKIAEKRRSASAELHDAETKLQEKIDSIKSPMEEYDALARRLNIVPTSAANASGEDFSLRDITDTSIDVDCVLSPETKQNFKAKMAEIQDNFRGECHDAKSRKLDLTQALRKVEKEHREKQEEASDFQTRLSKAQDQLRWEQRAMEEAVEKAAEQTEQCEVRMQKLREQRPADVERMHAFLQDARSDKLEMESKARTRFVSLRNSLDSALMELLAHKGRCEKNVQAAHDASFEAHGAMMGEQH